MLKSLPQKQNGPGNIYPVDTDALHAFVSSQGFKGTHVISNHSIWFKEPIAVRIPRTKSLTKADIISILNSANLGVEDFEKFVPQYLQDKKAANVKFDMFIEQSLHTKPKKKS